MNEVTFVSIAGVFTLVVSVLTILNFFKSDKKDGKADAKEIASIQTDIGYIKDGIGELKTMMQLQSKEQTEMKLKVQKIEDRIESIESRMKSIENNKMKLNKGVN